MAVKTFNSNPGPLQWVRATENFFEAGEHVLIGDFVEVKEGVAQWLASIGRAEIVTEEDVEAAKAAKTKKQEPAK